MSNPAWNKGDVVMVDVPYLDATDSVRRPALVVSDTTQMLDVVIAGITSRVRQPLPPTHYVIDRQHPDWQRSGLRLDSVVRCDRLFTVHHADIRRKIGQVSQQTMHEVEGRLKRVFGMP